MTERLPDRPSSEQFRRDFEAHVNPRTPEERAAAKASRERVKKTEAKLRRGLRPARTSEVLSRRIGPGPSREILRIRIGGPEVAAYFAAVGGGDEEFGHRLAEALDPQTAEEQEEYGASLDRTRNALHDLKLPPDTDVSPEQK